MKPWRGQRNWVVTGPGGGPGGWLRSLSLRLSSTLVSATHHNRPFSPAALWEHIHTLPLGLLCVRRISQCYCWVTQYLARIFAFPDVGLDRKDPNRGRCACALALPVWPMITVAWPTSRGAGNSKAAYSWFHSGGFLHSVFSQWFVISLLLKITYANLHCGIPITPQTLPSKKSAIKRDWTSPHSLELTHACNELGVWNYKAFP